MKRCLYIVLLTLSFLSLSAQTHVYLEHSDVLAFDEKRLPDAQILRGDVRFRHEDALMFCDSAYFYDRTNSVIAFGHIRFEQGDTLFGYGDRLYYDGNTRLARLCRNVQLVHRTTTLTTDSLNYDRNLSLAYYFTGGTIKDSLNLLRSVWGQYHTSTSEAIFRNSVHLQNNSFTFDTDTLHYNTRTNIARIVCSTVIVYDGETEIRSANGWYNTATEQSTLYDRSLITHTDGKSLTGDTIFYDKREGIGRLFHHILIDDTVQHIALMGHYGMMWEKEERAFATDSAMLIDYSQADTAFLHADTLFTEQVPYHDSILGDTTYRQLRAYHHVRGFHPDYQLVCDSLYFSARDSMMTLCGLPVCWSDSNQVLADSMFIYFRNDHLDHIDGIGSALATRQVNDRYFDQITGKQMTAFFTDNEIRRVDVSGNAQTIYYPKDDDGEIIGVNKTESSMVQVFMHERKIHHVLFTTATTGVLYPLEQLPEAEHQLPVFFWADNERPKAKEDIFLQPGRTERPKLTAASASDEQQTEILRKK